MSYIYFIEQKVPSGKKYLDCIISLRYFKKSKSIHFKHLSSHPDFKKKKIYQLVYQAIYVKRSKNVLALIYFLMRLREKNKSLWILQSAFYLSL